MQTRPQTVLGEISSASIGRKRTGRTSLPAALEFIVGAIFVFGGISLLYFVGGPVGTVLGGIHTGLGIIGFPVGYGIFKARNWGRVSALVLNPIAIGFAVIAEILLFFENSIGFTPFNDSVIGTIIGIVVACSVIIMLAGRRGAS